MKNQHRRFGVLLAAQCIAAFALTACGGGSGGSDPPSAYTVSATISGLTSGASLVLQNNGGDNLPVSSNGTIAFDKTLSAGSAYFVTILTAPAGETCAVTSGSGTIQNFNVNITVACTANPYDVGGQLSGLQFGNSITLVDDSASALTVSANGNFTFGSRITSGSTYAVTISKQPTGQSCSVANGGGTVAGQDITNVTVTCTVLSYTVSAAVVGLLPNSNLVLQDNGADDLTVTGGGTSSFSTRVSNGSSYDVTVSGQPTGQTCTVTGGSGTVAAANVTVTVTCPWHVLYTASYISSGPSNGVVSGFAIDPTSGAIAALPTSLGTVGNILDTGLGLTASSGGKELYASVTWGPNSNQQTEDDISIFSVAASTGALTGLGSPVSVAPAKSLSGSLLINPGGTFAYAQPGGNIFTVNSTTGALTPTGNSASWDTTTSPQGNPYDTCTFAPSGAFAYCTSAPSQNGGPPSGMVTQFAIDAGTGEATAVASVAAGNSPADIAITPDGKFAYVADGTDLWAYSIDPNSGALTALASSPTTTQQPINAMAMTPSGTGLYMVVTGTLMGYAIDAANGTLTPVSGSIALPGATAPLPALQIDPSGKFVYVPVTTDEMYAASIDRTSGALTAVPGSPFSMGVAGVTYDSLYAISTAIAAVIP